MTVLVGVVLAAAAGLGGCVKPKPAVLDKASVAKVHKLVVVPMLTSQEPSTGPIAAGMASERLQMGGYDDFTILLAPSLWRLKPAAPATLSDAQAVELARKMGAQAVLTGTVGYAVTLSNQGKGPSAADKGLALKRYFGLRSGSGSVQVRMLWAENGLAVYVHTASATGPADDAALAAALAEAMGPLETYLKSHK